MKKIKVGVFGAGRGMDIAHYFIMLGCEIVALCERDKERSDKVLKKLPETATVYRDFDEFIEHDMDVVILGNNCHEHAPYAIKCFEKNIHVFSECLSNSTMAEGVQLIRAFEKSKSIYMIAENYPQMLFNREMKKLVDGGTLGKILYAEGEYNHPGNPHPDNFKNKKRLNYYPEHWRNFLPKTYYITHSLGPVMWITGATPKRVTAMAVFAPGDKTAPTMSHNADRVAIITTLNDDNSVFRVTGNASFGGGMHNAYRVCGTKGSVENVRGMDPKVMLRYNEWDKPENAELSQLYTPEWNDNDEALIKQAGHGGGDYLTPRMFLDCIKEGKQPEHPFNVYSAVTMSSVAILGHRSVLGGGTPYDIPDFHNEEERVKYENDNDSPFYYSDGRKPTIPCCSHPDYKPSQEQIDKYLKLLKEEQ